MAGNTGTVTRYTCGHVGKINDAPHATVHAFIRVAEIRDCKVTEPDRKCPDCASDNSARDV